MAIAYNLQHIVKLLLKNGAELTLKACGDFFLPGGDCYYGETPLNFAVSLGRLDMVKLLVTEVQQTARRHFAGLGEGVSGLPLEIHAVFEFVSQPDSIGNTALHMCVIHKQTEILDWLLQLYPGTKRVHDGVQGCLCIKENAGYRTERLVFNAECPLSHLGVYTPDELSTIRASEHLLWTQFVCNSEHSQLDITAFATGVRRVHSKAIPPPQSPRFYRAPPVDPNDAAPAAAAQSPTPAQDAGSYVYVDEIVAEAVR